MNATNLWLEDFSYREPIYLIVLPSYFTLTAPAIHGRLAATELSGENWFPCGSKAASGKQKIVIYSNLLRKLARGVSTNVRGTCE